MKIRNMKVSAHWYSVLWKQQYVSESPQDWTLYEHSFQADIFVNTHLGFNLMRSLSSTPGLRPVIVKSGLADETFANIEPLSTCA